MSQHTGAPRVAVVVVAYNAESTLVATLDRIPLEVRGSIDELFILDDASGDSTHDLARAWAAVNTDFTTVVISHSRNLGYGGNQKAAYRVASERGIDVVVLLHADGQYAPEHLDRLLAPILEDRADAVLGSRMMLPGAARRGGMPLYKRLGNRILTRVQNALLGTDLSEFHSGYRAYRVAMLDELLVQQNTDGFDFDTQIIVQVLDAGRRILEVPIPTYYGDEICYVNGLRYAYDVVRDVVGYRMAKVGLGTAGWVPPEPEYDLKSAPSSSHRLIADALVAGRPGRVLDVGCSGGQLSALLVAQGHHVTGVDTVEVPGVRERVNAFHRLDAAALADAFADERFDHVVAGDVLEHLADPRAALVAMAALLTPEGEVLLSVPNVGHWYPRLRVLTGTFGYDRRGILDETHLRFFTRAGLKKLVVSAGLDVVEEWHTGNPTEKLRPRGTLARSSGRSGRSRGVLRRLRPQVFAYQNVLRCRPHAGSSTTTVYDSRNQQVGLVRASEPAWVARTA